MSKFLEQPSTNLTQKVALKYFPILLIIIWQIIISCYLELIMPNLLKKLPSEIKKNKLKTGIFLGLSAYWGIILVGTLVQFN